MTYFIDDNGNALDYSGEDFGLTKQVATWHDFKLKGDISLDFKIPNTAKNRKALGYYGIQQIDSPAFPRVPFNCYRDGNLLMRGYFVIKGHTGKEIECFFTSGNTNWFNSFKFSLKEIDFPDRYTVLSNAINTQKTATDGIIFPLVDWWALGARRGDIFMQSPTGINPENFTPLNEMQPCVYMHTVVKEMAQWGGVKISGDLMDDALFNRIVITPEGPETRWPDWAINQTKVKTMSVVGVNYAVASDPQPVQFDTDFFDFGPIIIYDATTYTFTVSRTATLRLNLTMYFAPLNSYTVWLEVNGAMEDAFFSATSQDYKFSEVFHSFQRGDTFQIMMQRNGGGPTYRVNSPDGRTTLWASIAPVVEIANKTHESYIPPMAIVPDVKATDFIKFLCMTFGAVPTYYDASKTLSLNKLSRFRKEDAEDWSEYLVTKREVFQTGVALHNYIQYEDVEDKDIAGFNNQSPKSFGGGDFETENDVEFEKTLYTIPFAPAWDETRITFNKLQVPFIQFYDLELIESTTFSAVGNNGGLAQFTCTFSDPHNKTDVYYISSATGFYTGYASYNSGAGLTNPVLNIYYSVNDSGTIVKYRVTPKAGKSRLLVVRPDYTLTNAGANYTVGYQTSTDLSPNSTTSQAVAWFDKPLIQETLDDIKDSLAIDPVNNRTYNNNIGERYHQVLENIYRNGRLECTFLLPTKVFQSFDFSRYVYLKTKDLTGYFFVQKIDQYKDASTPVKVELLLID